MFLFYDTETNTMGDMKIDADDPNQARIVELAGILTDAEFEPVKTMSEIIRPDGWVMDPGAEAIHKISIERAMDLGKPIAEIIERFDEEFFDPAITVCAYNIRYDNKMVRGERRRLDRPSRYGEKLEFDPMFKCKSICGGEDENGNPRRNTLRNAYDVLVGMEYPGAHEAIADADALRMVVRALRNNRGVDVTGKRPKSKYDQTETPSPDADQSPMVTKSPWSKPLSGDDQDGII